MTRFITAAAMACACLVLAIGAAEAMECFSAAPGREVCPAAPAPLSARGGARAPHLNAETRGLVGTINAKLRRWVRPTGNCPFGSEERLATYYWQGIRTATGERFHPDGISAAHRTLPFGTTLTVFNPANGRSATVRINDRGPYTIAWIDLSRGAARAIGMTTSIFVCVSGG